ncbi:hypothetical protein PR003_g20016 [Phytophthora rubi]|uniref:RxLR effector protein n=1 Tax=Phytophthora rubi TaxID=129364 RepID=A0A6A3JYY3_9STRA|nr:hypothetical protein PR001_g18879 [Phytophthora rubi]KAE9311450.1 hypothetical protein PR003_g20016 [Phytophthora rubi]
MLGSFMLLLLLLVMVELLEPLPLEPEEKQSTPNGHEPLTLK